MRAHLISCFEGQKLTPFYFQSYQIDWLEFLLDHFLSLDICLFLYSKHSTSISRRSLNLKDWNKRAVINYEDREAGEFLEQEIVYANFENSTIAPNPKKNEKNCRVVKYFEEICSVMKYLKINCRVANFFDFYCLCYVFAVYRLK